MSQGGSPGAAGGPKPVTLPSPLERIVGDHSAQLTSLQAELTKAFPTVQGQIAELQGSSLSTSSALSTLSNQMAAMAVALTSIQEKLGANPGVAVAPVLHEAPPSDPPGPSLPRPEPKLARPRVFGGDFDQGRGFLRQCELLFLHQPSKYGSDGAKIALIMSLLIDKALSWAIAAVDLDSRFSTDYSAFRQEFSSVFDHPTDGEDAAGRLLVIQQGSRSAAEYTLEFRILAADSRWDDTALRSAYRRGLSEAIKDLIVRDRPSSLNELITLALQMDERLRERRQERTQRAGGYRPALNRTSFPATTNSSATPPRHLALPPAPSSSSMGEEPMQIGRSRLSREEREQRLRDQLCLYCGKTGHFIRACPTRPKDPAHQ